MASPLALHPHRTSLTPAPILYPKPSPPSSPLTHNDSAFPAPAPSYYPQVPLPVTPAAFQCPSARRTPQLSHRAPIPPTISLSRYISPPLGARPPAPLGRCPHSPTPLFPPTPAKQPFFPLSPPPRSPEHSPAFLPEPPAPLGSAPRKPSPWRPARSLPHSPSRATPRPAC